MITTARGTLVMTEPLADANVEDVEVVLELRLMIPKAFAFRISPSRSGGTYDPGTLDIPREVAGRILLNGRWVGGRFRRPPTQEEDDIRRDAGYFDEEFA